MAAYTTDAVLCQLTDLGIPFNRFEHPDASNLEQQVKYCNAGEIGFSKNLLLKDKKGRFYLVSALSTTNIDLKILSQRLGLGKGGLRFAPEEVVQAILQVSIRCVAPFALINESASNVALLLDKNFQGVPHIFFHPLTNAMTISIEPMGLDSFLKSIKRTPAYVDLEAVVAVGKDQPPDLAAHVPSDAYLMSEMKEVSAVAESDYAQKSITKTDEHKANPVKAVQGKEKAGAQRSSKGGTEVNFSDVRSVVSHILHKASSVVISEVSRNTQEEPVNGIESDVVGAVSQKLSAEIEGLVMMLKNTAYTQGFFAGLKSKSSNC